MNRPKIRILLADDHAIVRRGLALVLRLEAEFEIVGEAGDGFEAVRMAERMQPDLVLLDWVMPKMDGLQAARLIKERLPATRTLILSGATMTPVLIEAIDKTVDGFIHKDSTPADVAYAIRVVAKGQTYLCPRITKYILTRTPSSKSYHHLSQITSREMDVLKLMSTAATYSQIGKQLHISTETVRTHAKSIMTKLNQPNRTQAVLEAIRRQLISLDG